MGRFISFTMMCEMIFISPWAYLEVAEHARDDEGAIIYKKWLRDNSEPLSSGG